MTLSRAYADDATTAASDWTGAYIGGHFGVAWGRSDWSVDGTATPQDGALGLGNPFDFAAGTGSYFEGLQAGYNYELPSGIVIGAQADISLPNTLTGTQTIATGGVDVADYDGLQGPARRMFSWFFLCFGLLASVVVFLSTTKPYDAAVEHRYRIAEGTVTDFVPMPYTGRSLESFVVGVRKFSYSDYILTGCFNTTASHGGPIRSGSLSASHTWAIASSA